MKLRVVVASVILGLLIAVVDQYFKTHLVVRVSNPGSVLGLEVANALIIILHIAVLIGGTVLVATKLDEFQWQIVGILMLVVSLSNLIDRVLLGGVVDYIQILGIWFNLADTVITLGIMAIVYKLIKS